MAALKEARSSQKRQAGEPRLVVCVVHDRQSLFEAAIAAEVFDTARPGTGETLYRFRIAQAEAGTLDASGGLRIRAPAGLELLRQAHTIVLPGWRNVREPPPRNLVQALVREHRRGARLFSICSGAFILGATGLLDGRSATTHWRYGDEFRAAFPQVRYQHGILYIDHGDVITSAGSAAGIDAALHLVAKDHGHEAANDIARTMVVQPQRRAQQSQLVARPVPRRSRSAMAPLMEWARARISSPLSVRDLARQASMSERTLLRHFSQQMGMSPRIWLRFERVGLARALLEGSGHSLGEVAQQVGFSSAEVMRQAFQDTLGHPPSRYRQGRVSSRETSAGREARRPRSGT
jgi:AraC family transcriptional activator FtrA